MALPNEEDNRVMTYLAKIAGRLVDLTPPRTRLEIFFAVWAGMDYAIPPAPYTRFERFLLAAMGRGNLPSGCYTRLELFFNNIAGGVARLPDNDNSLLERYLREIAGGGVEIVYEGNLPTTIPGAIHELIRYGKCVQDGTPTPTNPVDIVCNNGGIYTDGTPEVLTVGGANLLNAAAIDRSSNSYIKRSTGKLISSEYYLHTDFIPITGGVAYYFGIQPYSSSNGGLAWYSDADDETYISGVGGTALADNNMVATAPEDARYVRFSIRVADDPDWETTNYFCVNGALDAYQPYTAPQTATVPDLYAVGDYKDEVDVVSGTVTRRVGVKVLDGSESWIDQLTTGSARVVLRFSASDMLNVTTAPLLVTHGTWGAAAAGSDRWRILNGPYLTCYTSEKSLADFKSYLAAQYAAGTPVIVLYPLAAETTEEIIPQPITSSGVVSSTTNAPPAEVKITYRR